MSLRVSIGYRLTWDRRHVIRVERCEARAMNMFSDRRGVKLPFTERDQLLIRIDAIAETISRQNGLSNHNGRREFDRQ